MELHSYGSYAPCHTREDVLSNSGLDDTTFIDLVKNIVLVDDIDKRHKRRRVIRLKDGLPG